MNQFEGIELCLDVPMDPLEEMCQNVRGANGPVKNEQAKARRTNNKKKNRKKGANKRAASAMLGACWKPARLFHSSRHRSAYILSGPFGGWYRYVRFTCVGL